MTEKKRVRLSELQQQRRNDNGCKKCGCPSFEQVDAKAVNGQILRRYTCRACGEPFHTTENLKKRWER